MLRFETVKIARKKKNALRQLYYMKKEGDEWVPGTIVSDETAAIVSFAEDNDVSIVDACCDM